MFKYKQLMVKWVKHKDGMFDLLNAWYTHHQL